MVTLKRNKYEGEHKRKLYIMELRGRVQKANETLQDFAMEIERSVQLTYPGKHYPFLDQFKIETFVNGIRGPDVKYSVCAMEKSFAETSSNALAQVSAKIISKPQPHKLRCFETHACKLGDKKSEIKELLKEKIEEKRSYSRSKCFKCGKAGHVDPLGCFGSKGQPTGEQHQIG